MGRFLHYTSTTYLIFIPLALYIFLACGCESSGTGNKEKAPIYTPLSEEERIEDQKKKFVKLYEELLQFREEEEFQKKGFIPEKYKKWRDRVNKARDHKDAQVLMIEKELLFGDLLSIALEYISSNGEGTDISRDMLIQIENRLNAKKVDLGNIQPINEDVEKIRTEYEFVGKWNMSFPGIDGGMPFEIYKKNDKYVKIRLLKEPEIIQLVKKSSKYYEVGNKHDEYFMIDSNRKITSYDIDGLIGEKYVKYDLVK